MGYRNESLPTLTQVKELINDLTTKTKKLFVAKKTYNETITQLQNSISELQDTINSHATRIQYLEDHVYVEPEENNDSDQDNF